jgi:hypothetical protein
VSIAYYEKLAKMDDSPSPAAAASVIGSSGGSIPTRREVNERMLLILKNALRDVEERLASLQSEIETAREVAEGCFDIDALKKNPVRLFSFPLVLTHADPLFVANVSTIFELCSCQMGSQVAITRTHTCTGTMGSGISLSTR